MNPFLYLFNNINWKWFIIVLIIVLIIILIISGLLIIISYFVFKLLKKKLLLINYFDDYILTTKQTLKKYGHLPIKNIYLVRQTNNYYIVLLLKIITFYNYEEKLNLYKMKNGKNFTPYHTFIIIEVQLPNKIIKRVMIEKNNCINISTNFKNFDAQEFLKIKIKKKTFTINSLLEKTKKRIGDSKFFNWHICNNNCQSFIREFLISLEKRNYKKFYSQIDFLTYITFSSFNLHCMYSIINMYNLISLIL